MIGNFKRWASLALGLGLALPSVARAQDTTRADETFQAGRALLKDGKYADACPKFEESQRHDPASGTLLALAYCQELSGLLASSWANYLAAADLAAKEGQAERQTAATERAKSLAERYSTLTVVVPPELDKLPGLRVLRDGIELQRTAFNTPIPLNGGMHSIEAVAPGREHWAGAITLQQEADHQTVTLPVLAAESSLILLSPSRSNSQVPRADHADHADPPHQSGLRTASIGLAIGSGVALGIGATFGALAVSRNNSSNQDDHCNASGCDAIGVERRNSAISAAQVSTWSFVAAGALAAGSVVLYLKSSDPPSNQGALRLETGVGPGMARVALTRDF